MYMKKTLALVLTLTLLVLGSVALAGEGIAALDQEASQVPGGCYYVPGVGWIYPDYAPSDQWINVPGIGYVLNDDSRPLSWPHEGAGLPKERPAPERPVPPHPVKPGTTPPTYYPSKPGSGTMTVTSNAKVYEGPGTKYTVLGNAKKGEVVEIIRWDQSGDWCRVYYNSHNNAGWINAKYLK